MELSVAEGRVLGCLIEKQVTDEDAPGLSLDELRFSCNKTSERDPVVAFDDRTVEDTLLNLKAKGLARFVAPGRGAAPTAYRHRADERWRLEQPELAVLSILLLRGPQNVDEVWALVDEMCLVESRTGVEVALDTLAGRTPTPLAARLARSGGPDGVSWVEVLTGRYTLDPPAPETYAPPPPFTDRRGSGLPAREPWRPDERFDRRQRRDEVDDRGRGRDIDRGREDRGSDGDRGREDRGSDSDRGRDRDLHEVHDLRDRDRERERDRDRGRDHERDRDRRGELNGLSPADQVSVHRPPEPQRSAQLDPPVPMAVPADQPARPAPTLAEVVDRLANIERRLAGIEAALNSLRSNGQNQGQPQPQSPVIDPQQSQLQQPPLPSSRDRQQQAPPKQSQQPQPPPQLQLQQTKSHGQPPPPPPPPRPKQQGQAPSRSHR